MEKAIEQALKAHKDGNLVQAERLYRAVLEKHPTHADANHNLGLIISFSQGYNFALPYFKTALTCNPKIEQFWLSYISTLINNNQLKDAKREVKRAKKKGLKIQRLEELIFYRIVLKKMRRYTRSKWIVLRIAMRVDSSVKLKS